MSHFEGVPVTEVFIETGTFHGDTSAAAVRAGFSEIHTIELNGEFVQRARERFGLWVWVHYGASAEVLPEIIDRSKATTFYLDAHKTTIGEAVAGSFLRADECPLISELLAICAGRWLAPCRIIIDDASMMTDWFWRNSMIAQRWNSSAWPRVPEIRAFLTQEGFSVSPVRDDRIVATFRQGG